MPMMLPSSCSLSSGVSISMNSGLPPATEENVHNIRLQTANVPLFKRLYFICVSAIFC